MRIALKTCSYSVMHVCVAFTVAYLLSGDWVVSLSIGLIEPGVQSIAFFLHEYVWEKPHGTPAPQHVRSHLHHH